MLLSHPMVRLFSWGNSTWRREGQREGVRGCGDEPEVKQRMKSGSRR